MPAKMSGTLFFNCTVQFGKHVKSCVYFLLPSNKSITDISSFVLKKNKNDRTGPEAVKTGRNEAAIDL